VLAQNKERRNEMLRLKQGKLFQKRNLRSFVMEELERR